MPARRADPATVRAAGPGRGRSSRSARYGEIVDAAVRLIARDGLAGASLRAIAGEMGFTTGVITHHFRDKEALLVAAADGVFGPFERLLSEAQEMDDAFEGLRRLCVIPLPTTRAKRVIPRVYVQVLAGAEAEPAFAETFRRRYAAIRKGVQALLVRGQQDGSFRGDFDPAAQCDLLCALVDGLALHAVSEPSRFPPHRLVSLVTGALEKLRP